MTTPTRAQVVQIVMQANAPGLLAPGYSESLAQIIALARADLESTIEDQATEISKLISAVADHVTVRAEQRQQLAAEQAYAEQLRGCLDMWLLATVNDRTKYSGARAITRKELSTVKENEQP